MFYPTLRCSEASALIKSGAQRVDVRSPHEHVHQQHAYPARSTYPPHVKQQALKQLDKETPVLLYCASGQRSGTARRIPEAYDFTTVRNVGSLVLLNTATRSARHRKG